MYIRIQRSMDISRQIMNLQRKNNYNINKNQRENRVRKNNSNQMKKNWRNMQVGNRRWSSKEKDVEQHSRREEEKNKSRRGSNRL